MRSEIDPACPARIREVVESTAWSIPILYNGDVQTYEDIGRYREEAKADGIMIARGALKNASVFQASGPEPYDVVIRKYLRKVQN